jgi:hypothetical protein
MSSREEKLLIRDMAKVMVSEDDYFEDRRDTTPEEWLLEVESSGISADFSNDDFLVWFVGKMRQEFPISERIQRIAGRFFSLGILDPRKGKVHEGILMEILTPLGNREWVKMVTDYCIRKLRDTEVGQRAITLAKAFGVTSCSWKEIYGRDFLESVGDILGKGGTLSHAYA